MFGFLKILFGRDPEEQTDSWENFLPLPLDASEPAQESTPATGANLKSAAYSNGNGHSNGNGDVVYLSLMAVLSTLPVELKARIRAAGIGDAIISIPLETIRPQLARGVVKISFGELRNAAPHVFSSETDLDYIKVTLRLSEILVQLNSGLLARRQSQKHIEVPEEVAGPFGKGAHGVSFAFTLLKPEPPLAPRNDPPPLPVSSAPPRNSLSAAPTPLPPIAQPANLPPLIPSPPAIRNLGLASPVARTQPPQPTPPVGDCLSVPLNALAERWPEAMRLEITQLDLTNAHVAVPVEVIEQALKRGKIAFTWKALRSWIRPAPLPSVSAHDGAVLELPLHVVAPLFLAKKSGMAQRQKLQVDETIPNLFFGFPKSNSAAPIKQKDTNFYTPNSAAETIRPPATPITPAVNPIVSGPVAPQLDTTTFRRKPAPDTTLTRKPVPDTTLTRKPASDTTLTRKPDTNFISRHSMPSAVVSRAASLEGVAGALISLPDGLMVASELTQDVNSDTLAAFLPQIYARVSQCTNELRMGELNNVSFTVGNIPWRIFRVNAVFFAAFGYAGGSLPAEQLTALAAELDRKK